MEEIIENVHYEIRNSGFEKKLIAGIVVTGGGSQLKHLNQLIQYMTGMDSRIGFPNEHLGKGYDEIKSPMYATGVGLVINGTKGQEQNVVRDEDEKSETNTSKSGNRVNIFRRIYDELMADESDKPIN
jgi:cell division protein FtsA